MDPDAIEPGYIVKKRVLHADGADDALSDFAWSPDGSSIATASRRGVRVWDVAGASTQRTIGTQHDEAACVSYAPDGRRIAAGFFDATVRIWDRRQVDSAIELHGPAYVGDLAWRPDSSQLCSCDSKHVRLWDAQAHELLAILFGHKRLVRSIVWLHDSSLVASGGDDATIIVWDTATRSQLHAWTGHTGPIVDLAQDKHSGLVASASLDQTIRLWDPATRQEKQVLHGHTTGVAGVAFAPAGQLLASIDTSGTIRFWRVGPSGSWEPVSAYTAGPGQVKRPRLSFHPKNDTIAYIGSDRSSVSLIDLNIPTLLTLKQAGRPIHYTSAKVVVVGDSGAGKTSLIDALLDKPFVPSPSTHGIRVSSYQAQSETPSADIELVREVFLWDLAGQVDYQELHQLFLEHTALALVVVDPSHPNNPFGEALHWERALNRIAGSVTPRILVAGKVDVGPPAVVKSDLEDFCREHGFVHYVLTSSVTQVGIKELRETIEKTLRWESMPVTTSPALWRDMREFLVARRAGDPLTRRSDLREAFRNRHPREDFTDEEFDTVIAHAQAEGIVWRLAFGDFILLQPELLNNYASVVIRMARNHPEGLGSVSEREVLDARLDFGEMERISNPETERALLHAVVQLLLDRELALRAESRLVFPSKFSRRRPDVPTLRHREVAYRFTGPTQETYATLAVRLAYCGAFHLKSLWKDAAGFLDSAGGLCGVLLTEPDQGRGTISVYFEPAVSVQSRVLFLRFVEEHLVQRLGPAAVVRERIYRCANPECNEVVVDKRAIERAITSGRTSLPCLYCGETVQLLDVLKDRENDIGLLSKLRVLDRAVDDQKERVVAEATSAAKHAIGEFDVFVAYHATDQAVVDSLVAELRARKLTPWIATEQIAPGRWFQDVIQTAIPNVKSAAICIGAEGMGKWQLLELRTFISQAVEIGLPVIPVLLPGVSEIPKTLLFLQGASTVRFRQRIDERAALDDLEFGITGRQPNRASA